MKRVLQSSAGQGLRPLQGDSQVRSVQSPAGRQRRRPYLPPADPAPASTPGTRSCPFQITPSPRLAVPTETRRPFKRGAREAQQEVRPLPSLGGGGAGQVGKRKWPPGACLQRPRAPAPTHFQTAPPRQALSYAVIPRGHGRAKVSQASPRKERKKEKINPQF